MADKDRVLGCLLSGGTFVAVGSHFVQCSSTTVPIGAHMSMMITVVPGEASKRSRETKDGEIQCQGT